MRLIVRYLREIVYGGNDGIVTTCAVVAGFTGASIGSTPTMVISTLTVLLFGLTNLIGDGLSMALGNFVSQRAANDVAPTQSRPIAASVATFVSFVSFGLIPLFPFMFNFSSSTTSLVAYSFLMTLVALILLGVLRWRATNKHPFRSIMEVLIIGLIAIAASYGVGLVFRAYSQL